MMLNTLVAAAVALALNVAPLSPPDTVRVRGTNELGTYSLLYCTPAGYCNDVTGALPSGAAVDTVVGQDNFRARTKYGWSWFWYPATATCVPDSTYSNKTMRCGVS